MKTNRRDLWIMVALTFAGTVLRLTDLTGRSMWLDEGITLSRLAGSWQQILGNIVILQGFITIDLHPPLYFVLVKLWSYVAGDTEYALKLISTFASILLIPATYVLARRLFNRRTAFIAALIAFTSPAYQWYGHELRMYTVVPLLAAVTDYLVFVAVQPRKMRLLPWALWIGVTAVSVLTHYSLVGLCAAQVVFILCVVIYRRPVVSRRDAFLVVAGVGLFALIGAIGARYDIIFRLQRLAHGLSNSNSQAVVPLDWIVANLFNSMLFGMNSTDPSNGIFTWAIVAVCFIGLLLPLRIAGPRGAILQTRRARLFIALATLVPVVFVFLLSFTIENRPSFRYSIAVVPVLHVLLAHLFSSSIAYKPGLDRLRRAWHPALRWLGKAAGIVVILSVSAAQVFGLTFTFLHTPSWQDDWRGVTQYIKDHWQPGDVVFVNLITPQEVLRTYLQGVPIEIIPIHTVAENEAVRQKILREYGRIWYANTGAKSLENEGEGGRMLASLSMRRLVHFSGQTNILDLQLFDIKPSVIDDFPDSARPIEQKATGSADPWIVAYEVQSGDPYSQYPNTRLSLYWDRSTRASELQNYSVSVRVKDAEQRVWADWFMPADLETAPKDWQDGRYFRADYVVPIPLGLPRQHYQLELTLLKGEKAEAVRTFAIPIEPSQLDCCIRITHWANVGKPASPDAVLWQNKGVEVDAAEYQNVVKPGEIVPIVLTWKLSEPAGSNWQTEIQLDGLIGGHVADMTSHTGTREAPLTSWPLGEPVRSLLSLKLPYTVKPGYYRLSMSRKFDDGRPSDGFTLGIIEVRDYPRSPVAQTVQNTVNGKVGELTLLGYSLNQTFQRGAILRFELYWRVESQPAGDGVLFLHLMGPDGQKVAQDDNPPEQGARSTLTYHAGDGISQVHRLEIPSDAPGGTYTLYAGVYDRNTVVRWPAQQNGAPARDDLLFLGTLTLPDRPKLDQRVFIPVVVQGQ